MREKRLPEHVERITSVSKLRKQGFEGPDVDLRICLEVHGIVWRKLRKPDRHGCSWLFVYSIGNGRFDRATFKDGINPREEWNWCDFSIMASILGMTEDEFLADPFEHIVHSIVRYHGHENVFGTSCWKGFRIQGVRFDYHVRNLDDEREIDEFLKEIGNGVRPAHLVGLKSNRVAKDLRNYCHNKLTAMSLRSVGQIADALRYESICEKIYSALPKEVKW